MLDIRIKNCRIVDGTGTPWFRAEVGIKDGKIVLLTNYIREDARKTIDLGDDVLAPGFIDMHTHSDLRIFSSPEDEPKIMQGITTALVGQDGLSAAPVSEEAKPVMKKRLLGLNGNYDNWNWNSMKEYLDAIDAASPASNTCMLVPHGAVRGSVLGWESRKTSSEEISRMVEMTGKAMSEGAFGFSTGLIYPPCLYADEEELIALASETAKYGGFFVVHMRNERDLVEASVDEVVRICEKAGCPLHISHLKVAGRDNWGRAAKVLEKIDRARYGGIEVTFDQYPYTAGSTMLDALIPPVFHKEGQQKLMEYLADPDTRCEIRDMINGKKGPTWENWIASCGWDGIYINSVGTEINKWTEGKNLAEIAEELSKDPVDALCDLLVDESGTVTMTVFYGSEEDVTTIMKHEAMTFCSDSIVGGKPHPRAYGSSARVLGKYVREEKVLSLSEAVRRMTSAPAARLGLQDRGIVREGMVADLVAFSPERVRERGSYSDPIQFPEGFSMTMVSGKVAMKDGVLSGVRAGGALRNRKLRKEHVD